MDASLIARMQELDVNDRTSDTNIAAVFADKLMPWTKHFYLKTFSCL